MSTVSSAGKLKKFAVQYTCFTRLAYFEMFLLGSALNLIWSLRSHHPAFFSFHKNLGLVFTSLVPLESRDPVLSIHRL